jgi:hypothetical protein
MTALSSFLYRLSILGQYFEKSHPVMKSGCVGFLISPAFGRIKAAGAGFCFALDIMRRLSYISVKIFL